MAIDGTSLPAGVSLTTHGCGENFPDVEELPGGQDAQDRNRRVEQYFFDGHMGIQPPARSKNSQPGSSEYPEWVRRAQETHDFNLLRNQVLELRLHDDTSAPMPAALARVVSSNGERPYQADAEGWIHIELPAAVPAHIKLQWGAAAAGEPFLFERTINVDCDRGSVSQQLEAKLHNLGYDRDWPIELAVQCFQADYRVDHEPEPMGSLTACLHRQRSIASTRSMKTNAMAQCCSAATNRRSPRVFW